ncbi:hypothetical protein [Rathayibacter rathayi]|uniref:hypothetical protein n=1 Tax=Rathayibacter rathayi TaxID=33887 RepID=UPI0015E22B7F|nr:hypothetical protein [Rathayibacter rathayi]
MVALSPGRLGLTSRLTGCIDARAMTATVSEQGVQGEFFGFEFDAVDEGGR